MISKTLKAFQNRRRVTVRQAEWLLSQWGKAVSLDNKRTLLDKVVGCLPEPKIMTAWIELALQEDNLLLKRQMLVRTLSFAERKVPETDRYLQLLIWGASQDEIRIPVLAALGTLVIEQPESIAELIRIYRGTQSLAERRQILAALCQLGTYSAALIEFHLSIINTVEADLKFELVRGLLRLGAVPPEQIAYWLQSAESGDFQLLLIEYITDRSLPMEQALIGVIQSGHDPMCRKAALRALVSLGLQTPEVIRVLLETLEKDTAPEVRETCIRYFHCLLQLTPDLQGVLLQYLQKATSQQVCLLILELLTPYLSQSPDLRTTFIEQLQVNLHTQVAAVLYEALGQIALRDPQLKEGLLEAYFKIQDDRLRGIILRTLTTGNEPTDRFAGLYREALQAPDLTLKTWGLRGLLQLPLIPENVDVIAAGADLLLNVDLDTALRQAVARKIGRIAVMPAILRQKLQKVGDQSDSEVLREICRAALNRVVDEKAISATDLDDWYYRVEREGNVDGIFPYIYSIYDDYPQRCFPILKLVLLSPSCGYSRYANRITDLQLLRFLMSRNAIDDDICRYCIGTILQLDESYGQLGIYLAVLRTRPGFPGLRESLWALFRRKTDVTKFNPVLLRQTLVTVYGGDDAAGQAFEEHLAQLNSRIRAEPYLHFLLKNLLWGPTRQLLRMVLERPELWDEQMRVDLQLALKEFGDVINVKLSKPGVCND